MAERAFKCRDCGQPFVFTDSEQKAFAARGYRHAPSRCPACRQARHPELQADDWRSKLQALSRAGRMPAGRQLSTDVICSACGRPTQVPFVPQSSRPVYCDDCYTDRRLKASR